MSGFDFDRLTGDIEQMQLLDVLAEARSPTGIGPDGPGAIKIDMIGPTEDGDFAVECADHVWPFADAMRAAMFMLFLLGFTRGVNMADTVPPILDAD